PGAGLGRCKLRARRAGARAGHDPARAEPVPGHALTRTAEGLRGTARASRVGGGAMPDACALLRFDHRLVVGRSWAQRPHPAASCPPRLRSFALRDAFCDFLGAGAGCSARSVVAAVVDAVTAGANASSRVVCGELDRDAESCRLTGALIA